jgi:hypothetical protein
MERVKGIEPSFRFRVTEFKKANEFDTFKHR